MLLLLFCSLSLLSSYDQHWHTDRCSGYMGHEALLMYVLSDCNLKTQSRSANRSGVKYTVVLKVTRGYFRTCIGHNLMLLTWPRNAV
jgi:hypothetical protein